MKIPIYQVDAFASRLFTGNPAAVCPLQDWLEPATMQAIAAENNLAETAFLVRRGPAVYGLRWFTPVCEVDLCGHATLGSAFVVFKHLDPDAQEVRFESCSGPLIVRREGELLEMDFPSRPPQQATANPELAAALGLPYQDLLESRDYLAVYRSADEVRALRPDFRALGEVGHFAVIVTAPGGGDGVDFVSRFFAPASGIDEDPVTGSAHSTLIPYWSGRLAKPQLHALQLSARGGELWLEDRGGRVSIAGRAIPYLQGTIEV